MRMTLFFTKIYHDYAILTLHYGDYVIKLLHVDDMIIIVVTFTISQL